MGHCGGHIRMYACVHVVYDPPTIPYKTQPQQAAPATSPRTCTPSPSSPPAPGRACTPSSPVSCCDFGHDFGMFLVYFPRRFAYFPCSFGIFFVYFRDIFGIILTPPGHHPSPSILNQPSINRNLGLPGGHCEAPAPAACGGAKGRGG